MVNHEEQLKILQQKVQQLVKQYLVLQKENISLKKEIEKNVSQSTEKKHQIEKLQQQLDTRNLGTQVWQEEDKKLLQKRIDGYLKEIDKCLQLLNQ